MNNPAKVYLSRYSRLQSKCKSLEFMISSFREQAESITIAMDPNKVQSSPRIHDPIAEAAANIADTEQLLLAAKVDTAQAMNEITHTIMEVQGEKLQALLILHYIQGMNWDSVADCLSYEVRQIYRMHGEALQQVNDILVKRCQ